MSNQKLARIARIMYDLQERCKHTYWCPDCRAFDGDCKMKENNKAPLEWGITKADIERLEYDE